MGGGAGNDAAAKEVDADAWFRHNSWVGLRFIAPSDRPFLDTCLNSTIRQSGLHAKEVSSGRCFEFIYPLYFDASSLCIDSTIVQPAGKS